MICSDKVEKMAKNWLFWLPLATFILGIVFGGLVLLAALSTVATAVLAEATRTTSADCIARTVEAAQPILWSV